MTRRSRSNLRFLLPPSEAKATGGRGRPLRATLRATPIEHAREPVLRDVALLAAGDRAAAAAALHLPPACAAAALAANCAVLDSATMPALRRYTGVVYEGLGFRSLTPGQQSLAGRSVLIFSGLFGIVRGDDPVPNYRVPANANLPHIGLARTYWRHALAEIVPPLLGAGVVIDLRSADYAAVWRPTPDLLDRVISVRVLSKRPTGRYAVVSYASKLAKGKLCRELIRQSESGAPIASRQDIAEAWRRCGATSSPSSDLRTPGHIDLFASD
ncbi:MAG: YaaA family protein [Actinomycetota bacterium]|nr:YaaA family protein [Actinomycetota bacterium]